MPIFASPTAHVSLLDALEERIRRDFSPLPDVIVGLDARGFLFAPGLALRLGIAFAAVRKAGKMPGTCVDASYEKEYGGDCFQMQCGAVAAGQNVLVVDDIIATGGSARAAGHLVRKLDGRVLGYLFILEIAGLNGREKLGDAKTVILLDDV
ncbi:adenine phosphoribosyltransferase [Ophiocordyceps camponoti-floridani]|uniref:adenine phosphoribosyltransferase n=1 Tax=Ophiocordyceps camponoti-floridani TaxID=2030778 RepID=A0A8H4QAB8_9HYPO|nr:adenine phosphoribosyltransferase [Ophiocordyceps camponoti-floridani]